MRSKILPKRWLLIVFLLSPLLFSGESIEELEKKLNIAAGIEKVEILNNLAYSLGTLSTDKALEYGTRALELSRELVDTKGEAIALTHISRCYRFSKDYKKALHHAEISLRTAEKCGDKKVIGASLNNIGMVYYLLNNYQRTLDYFQQAYRLREACGDREGAADSLNNIGNIYFFRSDNYKALEFHLEALSLRKELGDKRKIAVSLTNVGSIYTNLSNYHKALEYYLEALEIHEVKNDKRRAANSLNNIGTVYGELGDKNKALDYFMRSLKIKETFKNYERGISSTLINIGKIHEEQENYQGALDYFFRALKMKKEIGDKGGISNCFNNIGVVYEKLGDYDNGTAYFRKSLKIAEENGDKRGMINATYGIGEIYVKFNRYKSASDHFEYALKLAKEIGAKRKMETIYKNLAVLYAAKEDYKNAYDYHQKYSEIKDTVLNEKSSEQIAEMQTRYDTLKKEKEIELLKKDKHILEKTGKIQKMTRDVFFIGFILVVVFAAFLLKKFLYLFSFWKKQKFIGGYRLLEKIGTGGMGTVYKAHGIRNKSEIVAVKILREELFDKEIYRKRFEREAKIIDQLNHPNIITVFERGQRKQTLFLVMEWVRGKTLRVKLDEEGRLELKQALPILIQVTDALHLIHRREIVHRDLKPGNIMLIEKDGNPNFVKLLDFGLAKMKSQPQETESGVLVGTVSYMSPRQLSGSGFTPACDIYSLGVIMYETVTGIRPFHGETSTDIMRRVLGTLPVEPLQLNPAVPPRLNNLIMEMLEKKAETRPSAGVVLERLEGIRLKHMEDNND